MVVEIGKIGGGQAERGRDLVVGAAGGAFEEELAVLRGKTKYGRLVGVKGTIGEIAAAAGPQVGEFGENVVDGYSGTPSASISLRDFGAIR